MPTTPERSPQHAVQLLFILLLLILFLFTSLSVTLMGAGVYRSTVNGMEQSYSLVTSMSYVTTKVRQNDQIDAVYLAQFGDGDALVLQQSTDYGIYQTWIYYHDGTIRELFTLQDNMAHMSPSDGQSIVEAAGFGVARVRANLLHFWVEDHDGHRAEQLVSLRAGEVGT